MAVRRQPGVRGGRLSVVHHHAAPRVCGVLGHGVLVPRPAVGIVRGEDVHLLGDDAAAAVGRAAATVMMIAVVRRLGGGREGI